MTGSRSRAPLWIWIAAGSYLAFFALLVFCDIRRPQAIGCKVDVRNGGLYVMAVAPGSPAAMAGAQPGDRIVSANGQATNARADWAIVDANIEIGTLIQVVVERGDRLIPLGIVFEREAIAFWRAPAGIVLLAVRAVQMISLAVALLLIFKLPMDPLARLGAWFLASGGVFCLVLPSRIASVWRAMPLPLDLVLWFPFASSLAIGAILLTFAVRFPRPIVRSGWAVAAAWLPMVVVLASFIRSFATIVYASGAGASTPPFRLVVLTTVAYTIAACVILLLNSRRLTDANERRRVRVLLPGLFAGTAAGLLIEVAFWARPAANVAGPLFASPLIAIATILMLGIPISFAYAIVRRRMFEVATLLRQGVRYAVARRIVLSFVPLLLALLALDVASQRRKPLTEVVAARRTTYISLIAAAVFAHTQRSRWLAALDRRFFREHYDAHRVLTQLTTRLRAGGSLDRVAPYVVGQIEAALHPRFAALMVRGPRDAIFRPVASAPAGAAPPALDASSKLVALARLLTAPFGLGGDGEHDLARQLSAAERDYVRDTSLELILPVCADREGQEVVILLGSKRSEEPFTNDDLELLTGVFNALALLLERAEPRPEPVPWIEECPRCGTCYDEGTHVCARDGAPLTAAGTRRVLAGRYRLDGRLGEGGMGKVYAALDMALARPVAVKLLRDELTKSAEAADRFRREAQIAASFTHPNVVTVYDFGVSADRRAFLVMEQLEGRTARDELRHVAHLDLRRTSQLLGGACAAVEAAHNRLLVHADLKPENLFLTKDAASEVVKVLDFGLAISVGCDGPETPGRRGMIGTPPYMAPEQLRDEQPVPAWDLWALAVIAFELLTGHLPFTATDAGWPVPLEDRLSGDLEPLIPFFLASLAIDPAARPASARILLDAFDRGAHACEGPRQATV